MTSGFEQDEPKLAAVIGHPITHSLSPVIHQFWAHQNRLNGFYIPIDAPPDDEGFRAIITALCAIGFSGANVTLPHKTRALSIADRVSENARIAGAANMLTFHKDGSIEADNSDIFGFAQALENAPVQAINGSALVLGAGGAARGVITAIRSQGINEIFISNRTKEKAETLAEEFSLTVLPWEDRNAAVARQSLLVNTTSLGMTGQPPLDIDVTGMQAGSVVADIVYSPLKTPLLESAEGAGLAIVDGLDMLMHQARPGFERWIGGKAVVDTALRATLTAALQRKA